MSEQFECGILPPQAAESPMTLLELFANGCQTIPKEPGIYWVLLPEGRSVHFHSKRYHPRAKLYSIPTLRKKFERCADHRILYIGKAEGRRGLRQRIKQYMAYGQGIGMVHQGGRAIWQIENAEHLLLAYEVCENPSLREGQLLQAYRKKNDTYPLANWRG